MQNKLYHRELGKFSSCKFFQFAQGNVNNIKIKMADEEIGLNHVDQESENVSDETISKSKPSEEENNLFSKEKKRKSKKGRKVRKSTWMASTIDDLVDCICSNENFKKKIIFTNSKTSKNAKICQKIISEVRQRCEKREELLEYTLE